MSEEIIGYIALGLGLLAMNMKGMLALRIIHGSSALAYLIYGLLIQANPVILAGVLFIFIHGYHIFRIIQKRETTQN